MELKVRYFIKKDFEETNDALIADIIRISIFHPDLPKGSIHHQRLMPRTSGEIKNMMMEIANYI